MSTTDRVERDITAWFGETAAPATPDYTDDILRQTAVSRQRPRWTFSERWLPMSVITFGRVNLRPVPWRAVGLLAVLGLLLAVAAALYVGSQPQRLPPPFGAAANGLVAYSKDGDIYTVDPITGARTAIVTGATVDASPAYSLDGSRLAFARTTGTGQRDRRGGCRRAQPGRDPDDAAGRGVSSGLVAGWSMDRRRRRATVTLALDRRYRRRQRPDDQRPRPRRRGAPLAPARWTPARRRRAGEPAQSAPVRARHAGRRQASNTWRPLDTSGASSGRAAGRPTGADSSTPRIPLGDRFTLSRSTVGATSRSSRAWRETARSTHGCRTTVDVSCSWNRGRGQDLAVRRAERREQGCDPRQRHLRRRDRDPLQLVSGRHDNRVRAQRRSQGPPRSRRRSPDDAALDHRGRRVLAAPGALIPVVDARAATGRPRLPLRGGALSSAKR